MVRSYVKRNAVDPARREGRLEFSVVAGEVHKALGFSNRVPLVCQALSLAGIGKDVWKRWGGGEKFLKQERVQFLAKDKE